MQIKCKGNKKNGDVFSGIIFFFPRFAVFLLRTTARRASSSCRYADSDIVSESVGNTTLHRLVVVYRGLEMVECREV